MNDWQCTLPVVETFSSIQGESTHAGRLCFFIRLAGCNLSCSYCDTVYAQTPDCGQPTTIETLLAEVQASGLKLVEITGGEPALQKNLPVLLQTLLDADYEVLMETNGSVDLSGIPSAVKRIIDVKLPSSGMAEYNRPENYLTLHPGDELKFVTGSKEDFEYALEWIDKYGLTKYNVPLIFSVVFGSVTPEELVNWLLAAGRPELRMQLQMHKFIWPPEKRGV